MRHLRLALALITAAAALPLSAQQNRRSPHETVSTVIGDRATGYRVTVVYGRPYTKDPKTGEARKIWGGLVPYGKIWRAGADEATLLITQQPIELGGVTVPAGAYTLWVLPAESKTLLVVNKQIGQWGQSRGDPKLVYDEAN